MTYRYYQSRGVLVSEDGEVLGEGYAGSGEGRNNPAMQRIRNVGPIPRGSYEVGEIYPRHPRLGPVAIPLDPFEENEMFGRGWFYMHGDNRKHDASLGCIVMPRAAREKLVAGDVIEVVA